MNTDVIRALTLITDNNDAARYGLLIDAAVQGVAAVAPSLARYEADYWAGFTAEYVRSVGMAVADVLAELLGEVSDEWWRAVLADVLQLESDATVTALGVHYMPEPVVVAEWDGLVFAPGRS